jgi:hypothetical protein
MSKFDVTGWIISQNPVRAGVYQVNRGEKLGVWYKFWNGEFWGLTTESPNEATKVSVTKSPIQNVPWRGLVR